MSQCDCLICQTGRAVREITVKYNMDEADKNVLLNEMPVCIIEDANIKLANFARIKELESLVNKMYNGIGMSEEEHRLCYFIVKES